MDTMESRVSRRNVELSRLIFRPIKAKDEILLKLYAHFVYTIHSLYKVNMLISFTKNAHFVYDARV